MKTGQAKDISSWDSVIRILCGYYSETRLIVPRPCCTLEPLGELLRHFRSLEILINNLSPAGPSVYLLETVDNSNANVQLRTTEPDHMCYIWFRYFSNFTMHLDHLGILFKYRFGFGRSSVYAKESAFLTIFREAMWAGLTFCALFAQE